MSRGLLVREDLDVFGCEESECKQATVHGPDSIVLFPRCHMAAGSTAHYDKPTGVLSLTCRECDEHVASFQIAFGEPQA